MARLQPDLVSLLPIHDRPGPDIDLAQWVLSLPQKRLMEICGSWVLESLSRLRRQSPLSNVLLRGCLTLEGEFDLSDAGAVAIGEEIGPNNPRREEIRRALNRAARAGVLIHLPSVDRYCIPFPVRLSFEGVDFMDELERETIRWRTVRHFAALTEGESPDSELGQMRHWRFTNLLAALETAVQLMEELLGMEGSDWQDHWEDLREIPDDLAPPLLSLASLLGRALVARQSDSGHRLLAAGAAAAAQLSRRTDRGELISLIGQYHLRRRSHQKAHQAFRRAEAVHGVAQSWRNAILSVSAQALVLQEAGNLQLATDQFLRASSLARRRGFQDVQLDNANCAARLLLDLNRQDEVVDFLTKLLMDGAGTVRYPPRAETQLLLGMAHLSLGNTEAARPRLFEAIAEARQMVHRPVEANGCLQISRLFHIEGQLREATNWARRSQSLFEELSQNSGQGAALLLLHRYSLVSMGLDEAGDQLARRALRHAQVARDPALEADCWAALLELVSSEDETDSEIVIRCRHIDALRSTWRHRELVASHLGLATAYEERRAHLAAAGEILRSQAISRSLGFDDQATEASSRLQHLYKFLARREIDYLSEQVSDELEAGSLFRQPVRWVPV